MANDHTTIGLLVQYTADAMRAPLVEAFFDTTTELRVRGIVFSPHNADGSAADDVLSMITPRAIDGLIVATPADRKSEPLQQRIAALRKCMPILATYEEYAAIPTIKPDRGAAVRMALEHLIECHGYRRIGILPYRTEHMAVLREGLAPYEANLDGTLELPRNIKHAAEILKSKRGPSRPQAILTSTGVAGRMLVAALQEQGVLVPHDIALIAADKVLAEQPFPALTTCGTGVYHLARHATTALIEHIRNGTPLESFFCPAELSLEESCGCSRLHICRDASGDLNSIRDRITALAAEDDAVTLGLGLSKAGPKWVGKAFDALVSDVETAHRDFLAVFDRMLNRPRRAEKRDVAVRRVLWLLQRELFATVDPESKAGNRSRRILREAWRALGAGRGLQALATGFHASRIERDRCFRAFRSMTYQPDWESLLGAINTGTQRVGIHRLYVCLRENADTPPTAGDILAALDNGQILEIPGDLEFDPATELFPGALFGDDTPTTGAVISLYDHWEGAYHGFVAMAGPHSGLVLETMREALSNGFATALTHRNELTAMDNVRTLEGLIPICSGCKKMRDDKGYWNQLESYISNHSDARLTHSFCPECARKMMADAEDVIVTNRVGT